MSAKFDWYEASLDGLPMDGNTTAMAHRFARLLLQTLSDDAEFSSDLDSYGWRLDDFELKEERGFNHYRCALVCYTPLRVALFRVLWNELSSLHVISSGKRSPAISDALRRLCPVHFVTRADSALDFDRPGDWDRLVKLSEACREGQLLGRRMSSTLILQDEQTAGKTYYLGSLKSAAFLRIYDKTREQRAKAPKHLRAGIPDDWTRAEVVARPTDKERRLYLAHCSPCDVWGASPVTQEIYKAVEGGELGLMPKVAPRTEDFNRAYWTMLQQYKKTYEWLLKQCGGDVGLLGDRIYSDLLSAGLL